MKRGLLWTLVILSSVATIAVSAGLASARHENARLRARVNPFEKYCLRVRWRIEQDATDFASGILQRQQEAAWRFGEPVSGQSYEEIEMCVPNRTIPQWDRHQDCNLRNDFKCLEDIANAVAQAIGS